MPKLKEGKIPHSLLKQITDKTGYNHSSIIQRAMPGFDVGTLDLAEVIKETQKFYGTASTPYLTYKSDPITFPTDNPARSLLIVNQNDMATSGSRGYAMTVTILLPPESEEDEMIKLQENLDRAARREKITILGGHSEVTSSVQRLVLSGSFIGFVPPEYYVGKNPQIGDKIILSGWIGAEGTGIIMKEGKEKLEKYLTKQQIIDGVNLGHDISISKRVLDCNRAFHDGISLIHDVTEGGFKAAIFESLEPLGMGARISKEVLPVAPVTRKVCGLLAVDPLRLIGSGAVMIYAKPYNVDDMVQRLEKSNKPARVIGEIIDEQEIYLGDEVVSMPENDSIVDALKNLQNLD